MNLKLLKFQGLLAILFASLLAAEWGYAMFSNRQLQEEPVPAKIEEHVEIELPSIPHSKKTISDFNEIAERPLFIEGRRPIVEAPTESKPQAEVSQIDDWALIGIYNKGQNSIALFSKKNEAKKYMKISAGQLISGFTLHEIQSDRVILEQSGQQKTVLLRKPRAEPTPAAPVSPTGRPAPMKPRPPRPVAPPPNTNPENANDDSNKN